MKYKASALIITFLFSYLTVSLLVDFNYNPQKNEADKEKYSKYSEVKNLWSEKKERVKGKKKFDSPDKFREVHRMLRTRNGEDKPSYKINYRIEELKKAKQKVSKLNKAASLMQEAVFIERGPSNVGGRTRGIYVDPDDPEKKTWFAASVGGGVWKTSNAGNTWELKTPDFPNLSASYFGVTESNSSIIYVGTGEGFGNLDGIPGDGIFKSIDKGESWTQLPSTINDNFRYVNRIIVDPSDENLVIAVTNNGIYKSTDGGGSWTNVHSGVVQDIVANPLNFSTLYATQNGGGVFKSTDAGDTWINSSQGVAGGRFEIDISATDTNRIYLSAETGTSSLYMSQDAGMSWDEVLDVEGSRYEGSPFLGAQGWYDNTIAVHPYDENIVFYGGIDLWKATIVFDSVKGIKNVETNAIESFFGFKDEKLSFLGGGLGTGEEYWGEKVTDDSEYVDIEVRFGPGMTQKAHMFENYTNYISFIDVPFQVWDITNNKQLAVCYNDIRKNDKYDLSATRGDEIFVVNYDYDSENSNPELATADGLKSKNIYVLTPKNPAGVSWDPSAHVESYIRIVTGFVPVVYRESAPMVRGYSWNEGYGEVPDIHVDHHELVVVPMNDVTQEFMIVNANDGGVAYSPDGGISWIETDENGYNTTQFYGADKRPGADEYFGGTQDNGTWQSASGVSSDATTPYDYRIGGDGFEAAWHYEDGNKLIGGLQFNGIYKSVDGGNTFTAANGGFTDWRDGGVNAPFITRIAKTNSDPEVLFAISRPGVWRSDDFGSNWSLSPINNLDAGGSWFGAPQVAISIADPKVVWAASYFLDNAAPSVSKDGGFLFTETNSADYNLGRISGLDTHPTDKATAYATFSFANAPKILRTTDYGESWEELSGFGSGIESTNGFPDVAVFGVVVMPFNTDILWAGTDIGIVESTDNGATWHLLDSNLPAVSIWEMKIVDDQIVLATHGRGIWSATLPELSGYTPPVVTRAPRINGKVSIGTEGLIINASLRSVYDSTHVIVGSNNVKTILNSQTEDVTIIAPITEVGTKQIYLMSYKDGETYRSSSRDVFLFEVLNAEQGYYTGFHSEDGKIVLNGFTIGDAEGFSSSALQTPHEYGTGLDYIALLRTPIIVAENDAILSYRDVAIIEPGEAGTVFGDEEFWDYVVVEGNNGGEWMPLLDGYDARADDKWLAAYDGGFPGNESMFKDHTVNLLDNFSSGDTVLVRFRLFSDPFVVGWGWLVDDLIIQGQFVDVDNLVAVPTQYGLDQNYPNPFNPTTTISFSIPKKSDVKINVYNNIGQLVETLYNSETTPGVYKVTWNAKVASGVYYYSIKAGDFVQTKKMILLK